jgi:hypothetical protein
LGLPAVEPKTTILNQTVDVVDLSGGCRPEARSSVAVASQQQSRVANAKMPQRSPFAIQELLGLNGAGNPIGSPSAVAAAAAAAAAVNNNNNNNTSGGGGSGNGGSSSSSISSSNNNNNNNHNNSNNNNNNHGERGSPQSSPPAGVSAVSYAPAAPHHKLWDYMAPLTNHLGNLGNLTASRMAYLNAQAAVAAAFLPPPHHPHPAHHVAHHQVHQPGQLAGQSPGALGVHPAAHAQHIMSSTGVAANHHQGSPTQHNSPHGKTIPSAPLYPSSHGT